MAKERQPNDRPVPTYLSEAEYRSVVCWSDLSPGDDVQITLTAMVEGEMRHQEFLGYWGGWAPGTDREPPAFVVFLRDNQGMLLRKRLRCGDSDRDRWFWCFMHRLQKRSKE